ncbi:MAG: ABC transporter ATP-binding protein [Devosia sp.]|jgi:peptide/nickel transport system ATP-binding protein|uniref:ABC transporter ATP-binding protein n=1 Tax=unclassified Devosia TaxID=196773 RepID=UPI0019EDF2C4|nr:MULTISPECIES: ATP-binding cassette domain-containing protein [unclassified Devosia]MBF0678829.1 ABC transporter ATP-binding protein [Devosia sp.]WEJ32709.1 ATP-binding cassette domain-containing protein [Devosia sp. SD17-2]
MNAITSKSADSALIELRDVCVDFRIRSSLFKPVALRALDHVSLAVHRGRTLGVVGESGSGKSTAAKVLIGLLKPSAGRIFFGGEEVKNFDAATRKRIGRVVSVVFQDPATALNARMLVRDALTDPLNVHGIGDAQSRRARVSELVNLVGLPQSVLDAIPAQLSGGQKQRVAIARALTLEPQVIVADEPTSALDVSVRAQILNLLQDLKRELDLGMVFISHDIQTVRHISDDIAVMNRGKVIEFGPGAQVLGSPSQDYTRTLLAAAPSLLHAKSA